MLTKYAEVSADVAVLELSVPRNAGRRRLARLRRKAHRHEFEYTPRRGFLYVKSRAISSRCNDNYDEFPAAEIRKAYRTFIGKPVFVNHHNADHRRARGVIIDAALHDDLNADGTEDAWVEVLMEIDAVRFPRLADEVRKGNIARTSMGTDVEYSECSACGNKAATPSDYCVHVPSQKGMHVRRSTPDGGTEQVLISEKCFGLSFFENSLLVEDPADPTAFVLGVDDGDGAGMYAREDTHAHGHRLATVAPRPDGGLVRTAARHTAYGETKAPAKVDTLRTETCPVCSDSEAFNGDRCALCGYMSPPDQFKDPDLTKAKEVDLRQDLQEASGDMLECDSCGEVVPAVPATEDGAPATQAPVDAQAQTTDFDTLPWEDEGSAAETDQPPATEADPDADDAGFPADWDTPAASTDTDNTTDGTGDPDATEFKDVGWDPDGPDPDGRTCPKCEQGTLRPQPTTTSTSQPKESSRTMAQNPAAGSRRLIITAIRDQQVVIEAQQAQIAQMGARMARLEHTTSRRRTAAEYEGGSPRSGDTAICHADDKPIQFFDGAWYHLAGGPSHNDVYPATPAERAAKESRRRKRANADAQAAAPLTTDSPEAIGASTETGFTPGATTSSEDIGGAVIDPTELAGLVDVTTPSGSQVSVPHSEGDITAQTPSTEPFDTVTAAAQDRFVAAMRLANLQVAAGIATGEPTMLGDRIAASDQPLGEIRAQINTLTAVTASHTATASRARRLVPQSRAGVPAPSLQSMASTPSDAGEWMFGMDAMG